MTNLEQREERRAIYLDAAQVLVVLAMGAGLIWLMVLS
jgi:hypothetical protein